MTSIPATFRLGLLAMIAVIIAPSKPYALTLGASNIPGFTGNTVNTPVPVSKGKPDVSVVTCSSAPSVSTVGCSDGVLNYADQCPSGNCACLRWTCSTRNPFSGNGAASMEMSIDIGNGDTVAFNGAPPDCYPFYGEFSTATTDAEITDLNGSICDPVLTSSSNATVAGAWQLLGWDTDKITDGAGGGVTGTFSLANGALKLTLKGRTY